MHSEWRCDHCGPVVPLHLPAHINADVMTAAVDEVARHRPSVPVWCPWPPWSGWTVTGVGWAADERSGARACAVACSGPSPLTGGPAELLLIAEAPGVGLASRYAGLTGPDPGRMLADAMASGPPHAVLKADGQKTPLWNIPALPDRSAYVGEARAIWLVAVAWPASAGYLLADDLMLRDLTGWLPPELVYGALCPRLHDPRNG
jgi:hypothetical protein